MVHLELERKAGNYGFEAVDSQGKSLLLDAGKSFGGIGYGMSPMQTILAALGGCSGIDIVSILNKQKQKVDRFSIKINGRRKEGAEPSLWEFVEVIFELTGQLEPDKVNRACALSIDKYCSVAETLRRAGCTIIWQVRVNELP